MHLQPPVVARTAAAPRRAVLNIAHRGASAVAPENTAAALRRAVALGADLVEVDVRRSRDGVLVLMHDPTLRRTTDVRRVFPHRAPWRVEEFTFDELRRLDAGSWKADRYAGERVPTLAEAMQLLGPTGVGLQVELKQPELYPGVVCDLVDTIRAHAGWVDLAASSRLVVQSFDFAAMKEHKNYLPEVPVGLLGLPARADLRALSTWADQVNPSHLALDRAYADHLRTLGVECMVWTVDRGFAMGRALRLGIDGVITNRPEVLARLVAQLGRSDREVSRERTSKRGPGRLIPSA